MCKTNFINLMFVVSLFVASNTVLANPPLEMVSSQAGQNRFPQVATAEQLLQLADADEDMVIFDTRSKADFNQARISWAISIKPAQLDAALLQKHVASKKTTLVFYGDADSKTAANAAVAASQAGYQNVYWLKGGWDEWQRKKLSLK